MPYNIQYDVKGTTIDEIVEPLTLEEAKKYCRVSPTQTQDDDLILELITAARELVEQMTGLSLVSKTIECVLNNPCGGIEFPCGPVTGDITLKTSDDNEITDPTIRGLDFKSLEWPQTEWLKASYPAGYTVSTIPKALKNAIGDQVAYLYEHRGDQLKDDSVYCMSAFAKTRPYSRIAAVQ